MKTNISSFDLANCRIQARIESFQTGREITFNDILERELNKAKRNEKSLINVVHFAPEQDESKVRTGDGNIGKTIIIQHENNNISRFTVVANSNEINPDNNIVSTRSKIGRMLKNAMIDDVLEIDNQLWHVMDIIDSSQSATA